MAAILLVYNTNQLKVRGLAGGAFSIRHFQWKEKTLVGLTRDDSMLDPLDNLPFMISIQHLLNFE